MQIRKQLNIYISNGKDCPDHSVTSSSILGTKGNLSYLAACLGVPCPWPSLQMVSFTAPAPLEEALIVWV